MRLTKILPLISAPLLITPIVATSCNTSINTSSPYLEKVWSPMVNQYTIATKNSHLLGPLYTNPYDNYGYMYPKFVMYYWDGTISQYDIQQEVVDGELVTTKIPRKFQYTKYFYSFEMYDQGPGLYTLAYTYIKQVVNDQYVPHAGTIATLKIG